MFIDDNKFETHKEELFNIFDLLKNPIIQSDLRDREHYLTKIKEIIEEMEYNGY